MRRRLIRSADLERRVLLEAGHRCAIPTCRHTDVEIRHIIPWSKCQKHSYDNLAAGTLRQKARAFRYTSNVVSTRAGRALPKATRSSGVKARPTSRGARSRERGRPAPWQSGRLARVPRRHVRAVGARQAENTPGKTRAPRRIALRVPVRGAAFFHYAGGLGADGRAPGRRHQESAMTTSPAADASEARRRPHEIAERALPGAGPGGHALPGHPRFMDARGPRGRTGARA